MARRLHVALMVETALAYGRQMLPQQWIGPGRTCGGCVDDSRRINVYHRRAGTAHGVGERAPRLNGIAWRCGAAARRRCHGVGNQAGTDQQDDAGARQTDDGPAEQKGSGLAQCGHGTRGGVRRLKCV